MRILFFDQYLDLLFFYKKKLKSTVTYMLSVFGSLEFYTI